MVQFFSESPNFLRYKPFALARFRIVSVVMFQTEKCKIVRIIVLGISINVRDLPWFFVHIPVVESIAKTTASAAQD